MQFLAVDDLDRPGTSPRDGCGESAGAIAGIGKNTLDEGEEAARAPVEDQLSSVAVLDAGRMNDDVQQETDR
jgi:hypothetical protein